MEKTFCKSQEKNKFIQALASGGYKVQQNSGILISKSLVCTM